MISNERAMCIEKKKIDKTLDHWSIVDVILNRENHLHDDWSRRETYVNQREKINLLFFDLIDANSTSEMLNSILASGIAHFTFMHERRVLLVLTRVCLSWHECAIM